MTARPFQLTDGFVAERCDFCGRCFSECPVMQLLPAEAEVEIHALIESGASPVLDHCTGCMACNTICPQDANPHTLIMKAWGARYRKQGLPSAAQLVLPYQKRNLHVMGMQAMPKEERALVRQWEENWRNPPGCDTMIYAGCNMMLLPFMLDSSLYAEIPIFGGLELCCGEPLYRMGCWEAATAAARNVRDEFQRMGLKKIITPCLACYHLFNLVYPQVLGIPLDVEVVSMEEWLCERIVDGKLQLSPLNRTVVLHDNCWPKASGDALFDKVRELLARLGVAVVEAEHARENALCCGMCAAAARYRLRDIAATAKRLLDELEHAPAEWGVEYCGGCTWLLSLANQVFLSSYSKPRYHILELVQMAVGETPKHRTDKRMRSVLYAVAPKLLGRLACGDRFWLKEIAGNRIEG